MSRAESVVALRARIKELEAEVAKWKQDYKDLALAIAQRDGYAPTMTNVVPVVTDSASIPGLTPLPTEVFLAIEGTTEPHSESRTAALTAARELLERGVTAEAVAEQIRLGAEVKV